jgi:hypothetical protein
MKDFLKSKYVLVLLLAAAFIVYRSVQISMFEESARRNFMRGDAYSDINLYSAVHYFNDSGLTNTYGLPVHYYKVPLKDTTLTVTAYTHYPALPDVLAYSYSKILGSQKEVLLRLPVVLLSLLYAFLIFVFLNQVIENKQIVWLSWLLIVLSNYYLGWSDSLHKHVYEELLKCVFILLLLRYEKTHSPWVLFGMFLTMLTVANVSFEPIVYLAIICVGYSWYKYKKIFSAVTLIPAVAAVLGVAMHFAQNIGYFGSLDAALFDLTETARLRAAGIETSGPMVKLEQAFGLKEWLSLPFVWLNRAERFFPIPAFALIAMGLFAYQRCKLNISKTQLFWSVLLLVASFSWCMVMAQHAYVHAFTMRQAGLFYALISGSLLYYFWQELKASYENKKHLKFALGILILVYAVAMFATQHIWDLWVMNTFG